MSKCYRTTSNAETTLSSIFPYKYLIHQHHLFRFVCYVVHYARLGDFHIHIFHNKHAYKTQRNNRKRIKEKKKGCETGNVWIPPTAFDWKAAS